MKKTFLLLISLTIFTTQNWGQTAADFTKDDCLGNTHILYNYLNNEEVVILEFAMGCSSCTDAAEYLLQTKDKYAVSNPGKVQVFYLDYWPGNDCASIILPATAPFALDAVFEHAAAEKNVYFPSASPMPGIVIAAGSSHQVIYQKNNFMIADTLAMEQAITLFFATAEVNENRLENSINIAPNPVLDQITIQFKNKESEPIKINLFHMNGQLISTLVDEKFPSGEIQKTLNLSNFPKGIYYINIANSKEFAIKKIIII